MISPEEMILKSSFNMNGMAADSFLELAGLLPLAAILVAAVASDLREQRIPNSLVIAGIAIGLVLHTALPAGNGFLVGTPGGVGLWRALQGLALGGAAMLPLYVLGVMGAGDVKLMAAVGTLLGPDDIIPALLGTFLAGGFVSLAVGLYLGAASRLLRNIGYMLQLTLIKLSLPGMPAVEPPLQSVGKAPYAVAVALGTLGGSLWVVYG